MAQIEETDLVYKGPWVRSAQQRLFQTLESDYAFPRATCRSLVNLIWDFLNETFGETKSRTSIPLSVSRSWKSYKMQMLPAIDSQDLLRFFKDLGFIVLRQRALAFGSDPKMGE